MSFGVPLRNGLSLGLLSTSSLASSAPYTEFIAPNLLYPPLTLTRAQTGGALSTAVQADGATLATFGADVARFNGAARWLLVEGQRTNAVLQPVRTASTTGAWSQFGGTGATATITANYSTAPNGALEGCRVRWNGTGTGTPNVRIPTSGVVSGTTYAVSAWVYARSLPSITSIAPDVGDGTSGPSVLSQITLNQWCRVSTTAVAGSNQWVDWPFFGYGTGDLDIDFWGVQVEAGAFASSLILPPASTPGASTRGDDRIEAPLSSFGIAGSGVCTVLWSGLVYATGVGAEQCFVALDDGTGSNSYRLRNLLSGSNAQLFSSNGGVTTGVGLGALTTNTVFRLGMTVAGGGIARASFNGGAPVGLTAGPTAGLTTLRVNNAVSGAGVYNAPVFGETATFRILPYALSDADLQAAVAALPT